MQCFMLCALTRLTCDRQYAGEPGNDSEAEAHSAMGGGDDADDVTTEMIGAARTTDAASAMMEAVAKVGTQPHPPPE